MSVAAAHLAVTAFLERTGGGDIKLFGGEPLLNGTLVRAVLERAETEDGVRWVNLCTNGLLLDSDWLELIARHPKTSVTLSIDGPPETHRKSRRPLREEQDVAPHVLGLLPGLLRLPRTVISQTIAPAAAKEACESFEFLLEQGVRRFNLLPAYYIPWTDPQLRALDGALRGIARRCIDEWEAGRYLYLRNLFTRVSTPFFNDAMVVDSDGRVYPSDIVLLRAFGPVRSELQAGTVEQVPSMGKLRRLGQAVPELVGRVLPSSVLEAVASVDGALARFCAGLYGPYARFRKARRRAGSLA